MTKAEVRERKTGRAVAELRHRVATVLSSALADYDADQLKRDLELPRSKTPFRALLVGQLGAAMTAKPESAPASTSNLNVVIVGQAPTAAAWLEQVKEVRQLGPAKVIDTATAPAAQSARHAKELSPGSPAAEPISGRADR